MHQPAITHRGEQSGKRYVETKHMRAHVAMDHRDGVPRTKGHIIEYAAVLAQGDFAVGPAIEVIEDGARQPPLGQWPKVRNTDDMRRSHRARRPAHRLPALESM